MAAFEFPGVWECGSSWALSTNPLILVSSVWVKLHGTLSSAVSPANSWWTLFAAKKSPKVLPSRISGAMVVASVHLELAQKLSSRHPGSCPSRCSGTFRCRIAHAQAKMANRQLQRISRVPQVSGPDTKFVVAFGIVQEDSKVVYAKPTAGASKSNNIRSMVRAYRFS